jgi:hypothetical protein
MLSTNVDFWVATVLFTSKVSFYYYSFKFVTVYDNPNPASKLFY